MTQQRVDFAILVDHKVEIKENEKKDSYTDIAREVINSWNIKVTVIITGVLRTVSKSLYGYWG